ncbi:MAG: FAD-binding protein [Methylophaga sp.]|nr:FAD-binding protein [Methylophaga sp.]
MDIEEIQQRIKQAEKLHITEKSHNDEARLDMSGYAGVIEYYPEELVITVKAGTTIATIEHVLAQQGQALTFSVENSNAITIGCAYAVGSPELSDAVLGIKIIDGQGRLLRFGGQVMKNVAGYDVARLLVGSRGKLAVICEVSFKVLPLAYCQQQNREKILNTPNKSATVIKIEQGLKTIFDPKGVFI